MSDCSQTTARHGQISTACLLGRHELLAAVVVLMLAKGIKWFHPPTGYVLAY
jgi:hypothetical protein